MTDLLLDFEAYFVSKGISVAVFRDNIQDTPDTAIAIYEYQGSNSLPQIGITDRSIQISARDKSATKAKKLAQDLYKLLVTEEGILNLTPERWTMTYLLQPPFKIQVDDKGRTFYGFNITVTTYND